MGLQESIGSIRYYGDIWKLLASWRTTQIMGLVGSITKFEVASYGFSFFFF